MKDSHHALVTKMCAAGNTCLTVKVDNLQKAKKFNMKQKEKKMN